MLPVLLLTGSQASLSQPTPQDSVGVSMQPRALGHSDSTRFTPLGIPWLRRAERPELLRTSAVVSIGVAAGISELARRKQDERRLTGPFTVRNDWSYTRSADKFGHVFFTQYLSQLFTTGYRWSGYDDQRAAIIGAASGFTGMLYYELLDGLGSQENFSPIDVVANGVGAGLFAGRAYVPELEHIRLKMSYWPTDSACQYTCDYEGQTAWITMNPRGLAPESPISVLPDWLNIGIGYGARNGSVSGGFEHSAVYVGLDFEPAGLPIRGRVWDEIVPWLQLIHFPAPALRLAPDLGFEPLAY